MDNYSEKQAIKFMILFTLAIICWIIMFAIIFTTMPPLYAIVTVGLFIASYVLLFLSYLELK